MASPISALVRRPLLTGELDSGDVVLGPGDVVLGTGDVLLGVVGWVIGEDEDTHCFTDTPMTAARIVASPAVSQ